MIPFIRNSETVQNIGEKKSDQLLLGTKVMGKLLIAEGHEGAFWVNVSELYCDCIN